VSRAERLLPYAERYIHLVIERNTFAHRMRAHDLNRLDFEIKEALVDFEAAELREQIAQMPPDKPPPVRKPLQDMPAAAPAKRQRRHSRSHPWNRRAVMPKR
jgi:hypothetical protein